MALRQAIILLPRNLPNQNTYLNLQTKMQVDLYIVQSFITAKNADESYCRVTETSKRHPGLKT